jgi:hypothetical protein
MPNDEQSPAKPEPEAQPNARRDEASKLGRDEPGEGLDTGVDTGAIQPGQSGDNGRIG